MKRKLKILIKLIKNFFNINYDEYVPYRCREYSLYYFLRLDNLKFFRKNMIKYWHKKASAYEPFSPYFNKDKLTKYQKDMSLPEDVRNIYKSGSSTIENVLSATSLKFLNQFCNTLDLNSNNNYVQVELPQSLENIRHEILNKLRPVHDHFFFNVLSQKKNSKIYVGVRIDYSFDGVDSSPVTANWHVDRFLPTLNAIFFPNGSNWGEFEKDVGNPLITEKDIEYYINDKKKDKKTPEQIRDNLYVNINGRTKKKFSVKENTMVVGTHHLQHRRSPFNKPGKRVAIFIDYYNFFSRKDLTI